MRKFMITVNGTTYEVDVEEVGGVAAPAVAPVAAPVAAPAPKAAPAPAPKAATAPKATGAAGSVKVTSPMPGTIVKVLVNVGDTVKKGQPLMVLEAMKMENDIPAPQDGTVASINTSKGASVNTGEVLASLS